MVSSLEIRNYRNLKDLKLNSLSRVNLITGKNNTGKTSLLDAISIFAKKGDIDWLLQLLEERGENYLRERSMRERNNERLQMDQNKKTFSSFFFNRNFALDKDSNVFIGEIESTLFGEDISSSEYVNIGFEAYIDNPIREEKVDASTGEKRPIMRMQRQYLHESELLNFPSHHVSLRIKTSGSLIDFPLDSARQSLLYRNSNQADNVQYIHTRNIDKAINSKLWDNITLTDKEQYIDEAIRIIEPSEERVAFINNEDESRYRTPVIKIRSSNHPLPLKSMGDGVNRLLTIALALVNAENGYLLIDEFENGLHYSVQEKLWEIVFQLSEKLNVQVFATTHSNDCIKAFENVLNNGVHNPKDGKLIRLDNKNGAIREVEFDAEELKAATDLNIEIR